MSHRLLVAWPISAAAEGFVSCCQLSPECNHYGNTHSILNLILPLCQIANRVLQMSHPAFCFAGKIVWSARTCSRLAFPISGLLVDTGNVVEHTPSAGPVLAGWVAFAAVLAFATCMEVISMLRQ